MSMNNPISTIPPIGQPTGMMPGTDPSKFKPVDPMRVIRGKWPWIVAAFVIGGAIGVGGWLLLDRYVPKFTSEAQFDVQATKLDPSGRNAGLYRMQELEPLLQREINSVLNEPVLRQTLTSPSVQGTKWFSQFNNDMDAAFEDLDENVLSARHIPTTPLFVVSASTKHEADAQIILTAVTREFMRRQTNRIEDQSQLELRAAQDRYETSVERIDEIRGDIKRFLQNTPLEVADGRSRDQATLQVQGLVVKLNDLTDSLNSIQATYNLLIQRQQEGDFAPSDEERQQIEFSPEIQAITAQLRQLRLAREPLMQKFGSEHIAVKELDSQILTLEREHKAKFDNLARLLFNAKIEQASLELQIVQDSIASTNEELTRLKVERQENVRLTQEYDTLQRKLEQSEIERVSAQQSIEDLREFDRTEGRVIVRQTVPPQQAKQSFPPHPAVLVAGSGFLFTGFVLGIIFLREVLDQRIRSATDIQLVPDASLIGTIPSSSEDPGGMRKIERVVEEYPGGLLAESFRQVRTAVLSKMDRRGYKTLMLVSAKPGAGVTAAAQNLAASCALSGRRVLLIDANFRRPALANLMGLQDRPGLADLLQGDEPMEQIDELTQSSETEGLSLLPAGNSDNAAAELFENPRFRELLARLEANFDLLIIDAPPALLTSDAQLLSRHIDAMLIISRAMGDTRGMLQRLYRELDGQRADILGVVLNGVQSSAGGYLKRNFREFHDYAGPDRRKAARPTSNRSAGNGSSLHDSTASPSMVLEENETADDQEPFEGFEMDDEDNTPR